MSLSENGQTPYNSKKFVGTKISAIRASVLII